MTSLRQNDIQVLDAITAVRTRPGMYVGSTSEESILTYVYNDNKIVQESIPQIPALSKIFSEIVDNCIDEAVRTDFQYGTRIKITFDPLSGEVTVEDNGRGLPIELDEASGKYTPEIIYTTLHAGSNFNDDDPDKKNVLGTNGVGSSLCNIFSTKFTVETANGKNFYKQTYENAISKISKPKIKECSDNFTLVRYTPDFDYFKISDEAKTNLGKLYYKRIKDLSFAYPEITFWYNKEKIVSSNLKSYLKQIHEVYECNEVDDGRIGLFYSDTDFQQLSFVNGGYTSRGGTHIDYAVNMIVDHVRIHLKKKFKIEVKPSDIRSKLFLLLAIRMKNPAFDSQTKERLISSNNFKDLINSMLSKKFLDSICRNEEIILPIVEAYKLKEQVKENVKLAQMSKTQKRIKVEKYLPAVKDKKILFLSEGDSANSSLCAALGRDFYSFFPLRGKPLNTLEVPINKIAENEEMKNITTILNLNLSKDVQTELTHDYVCFATDADADGKSIRSLLLCFFYRFTPSLLKSGKIKYLRTPVITLKKNGKLVKYFFSINEYAEFAANNDIKQYTQKYFKGLGSWSSGELESIIEQDGIDNLIQSFDMQDAEDEEAVKNWMSKERVESRKINLRGRQFDINTL